MDKKTFTAYMINRFLSMNMNYIDIVNEVQCFTNGQLGNKEVYNLYKDLLPKKKSFFGYIKGTKNTKYSDSMLDYLTRYFQVSKREVKDYLDLMSQQEIQSILQKYGLNEKEIKRVVNER